MYKLRNMSNLDKTVKLKSVSESGGLDTFYANGAKDEGVGETVHYLSTSRARDTMHFNFFPWWNNSSTPPHFFDIEINGVLFDMSEVTYLGETQEYPQSLSELTNYIKLYQSGASYDRLFIRNVTNEPLKVKLLKRTDWKEFHANVKNDPKPVQEICDDGKNGTVVYKENGDIEFTLAPYVPFDKVPESDKMILELTLEEIDSSIETINMYVNNHDDQHKDDYIYIDWGNGTHSHVKFLADDRGADSLADYADEYYADWYLDLGVGKHIIKIHTSHPLASISIQNVSKVLQWGSYVTEEIYDFDYREAQWDTDERLFIQHTPQNEPIPEWLAYYEAVEDKNPDCQIHIPSHDRIFTFIDFGRDNPLWWNGYVRNEKILDYRNYTGRCKNAKIVWGETLEDYPFGGFTNMDQALLTFSTTDNQGRGMLTHIDFQKDGEVMIIGPSRENNSHEAFSYKVLDAKSIAYLIDLKKLRDIGIPDEELVIYFRAVFTEAKVSGRVDINIKAWSGTDFNIATLDVNNPPITPMFEKSGNIRTKQKAGLDQGIGECVCVLHYDPIVEHVTLKPVNSLTYVDYSTVKYNAASPDVFWIYGIPGKTITYRAGSLIEGEELPEFTATFNDAGMIKHVFDPNPNLRPTCIVGTDYFDFNPVRDYFNTPVYDLVTRSATATANSYFAPYDNVDYMYVVGDEPVSDSLRYADISRDTVLYKDKLKNGNKVKARVTVTSIDTGRKITFDTNEAVAEVLEFEDSDIFRIAIPGTWKTGSNNRIILTNRSGEYNLYASLTTPGSKYQKLELVDYYNSLTLSEYYIKGWGGNVSYRGLNEEIVDILFVRKKDNFIPKGKVEISLLEGVRRILQFGNAPRSCTNDLSRGFKNVPADKAFVPDFLPKTLTNLYFMFSYTPFNKATEKAVAGWDVSNVTSMYGMFRGTTTSFNGDISGWDVSNVTAFNDMFAVNPFFNQDLTQWCTAGVTGTGADGDIGGTHPEFTKAKHPVWGTCPRGEFVGPDIDEVINEFEFTTQEGDMAFFGEEGDTIYWANGTVSVVDGSKKVNVTDVGAGLNRVVLTSIRTRPRVTLAGNALISLINFPVMPNVRNFRFDENYDLSPNLISVPNELPITFTSLEHMFYRAGAFNQDISGWDTSRITNMKETFRGASIFNQDISGWDVSNVTNMYEMFAGAAAFNQDISAWNVSNVASMYAMLKNAHSFNQDLSKWCVVTYYSKPQDFDTGSTLFTVDKHPVWGTCPRGEYTIEPLEYDNVVSTPLLANPYSYNDTVDVEVNGVLYTGISVRALKMFMAQFGVEVVRVSNP